MIRSGYDLLTLATDHLDDIYPSKSPTCEPKMVGCGAPHPLCVRLEYTWGDKCRAPSMFDPDGKQEDCPNKQFDVSPKGDKGTLRHASNHKTGKSVIPRRVQKQAVFYGDKRKTRQERKRERTRQWVLTWLSAHLDQPAARATFYDSCDIQVSLDDYERLCDDIWEAWCDARTGHGSTRNRVEREADPGGA